MEKGEESGSSSWSSSFFMQTTEDVARAVAAAAAAVRSPRPSVVFSSKDERGTQLHKLQHQVSRILKGLSKPPEVKSGSYNPEILTSQKRQWANFQLQLLDHRVCKEPSKLFESVVVLGLPPNSDVEALQSMYFARKFEGSGRFRNAICGQNQSRIEPNLEPQVLFVYPPEKQLPLKHKDLLSFCFPAGVEVADASALYGCCVLVEEIIQKPSGLISTVNRQSFCSSLSRHILTTRRCYCILSRLPFFELHFGVLNSIFIEERLERVTKQISDLDFELPVGYTMGETSEEKASTLPQADGAVNMHNGIVEASQSSANDTISGSVTVDISLFELQNLNRDSYLHKEPNGNDVLLDPEKEKVASGEDPVVDSSVNENFTNKQSSEKCSSNAVLPLLQCQQCDSLESSSSFQGSSSENRHFRSGLDEIETEEASSSGRDIISAQSDVLEWAKANNHGSLQIICDYYQLRCPKRGSTIKFRPLDHLYPLEYHRPDETVLHIFGSTIDLRSCSTSLELAEGILSALVLSIIPLIRPYQWQSLLMPVKSPTIPQLPQHKELYSCLSPYHEKLVGESYLGKKRPVYECTDVQWDSFGRFMKWLSTTFMISSYVAFGFLGDSVSVETISRLGELFFLLNVYMGIPPLDFHFYQKSFSISLGLHCHKCYGNCTTDTFLE
ncbi:UNVERIFIED_CONTAM: hypothetical protein Sindi_2227000 [Sesamum indicum]